MKTFFKVLIPLVALNLFSGSSYAKEPVEKTPENMTCKEFVDMNPKAMTPVAFWVINKNTDFKGGDYVDWHEVDTASVPLLIKICKKKPESKLRQWINEIK